MKQPTARDLLAGIDAVAWSELWVYRCGDDGPLDAREVPQLLRTLARLRGGRRVRRAALWQLECSLEHQGGLARATEHAIPFVLAMLRGRPGRVWQRRALLELLGLFTVPQPGNLFPDVVDPTQDYGALDPRCFHACADPQLAYRSFCAVEAGVEAILPLVDDPSVRVGCEAIGLLAQFRRRADIVLPALRARQTGSVDTEAPRIACALIADAMLAGYRGELAAGLSSTSPLVRLGAACALAIAAPDDVSPVAVATLCATSPIAPAPFTFGGDDFRTVAVACIARLPARHDALVIDGLLRLLAADPSRADVLWLLLARAFPGTTRATVRASIGPAPPAAELTELQVRTLEAIRAHVDLDEPWAADAIGLTAARP